MLLSVGQLNYGYMRARLGLGEALWITGEKDATIQNFKGMLELNPGDNQGIRYILAAKLLEIGKMDDLRSLLDKCADEHSDLSRRRFSSKMENFYVEL